MNQHEDHYLTRLIRIETRVARIMEVFGLPTRMDWEDLTRSPLAVPQPMEKRLARIETRIVKLMQAMNINPKTGEKK